MENKSVLELKQLTKKIRNKTIVDKVSFSVNAGEIFGFLGPNGAGKTTTIRMITGLIKISQGDVWIDGYSIHNDFIHAIRHVGGIIENPDLYKYLSGYQNLKQYARMVAGVTQQRIDEVIRIVGLTESIHEKVGNYSLGMRQRLGLAQAILHHPSLLILDEPTNGLDPEGIHELRDYLKQIAHQEGVAVLVSSHLLSEMQLMCDRVGVLRKGKMIAIEDISSLVNDRSTQQVKITIDPAQYEKVVQILEGEGFSVLSAHPSNELILDASKKEIPHLNKTLADKGILIYSIQGIEHTLEEQFLNMMEGLK
ncbi:ABC transporter ATP-binding protein [Enterococcus dongliensis]|uniref:ABC transporter ATP-binding protein n=1 Tax=Enterococcus dongliensis TaxID=2559925 RepID=UPI00288CACDF|nr:ABC transporter ATP-binding protein [Enterococcus dongliensis]MDT2635677.1 ABC transporter ATP-binding protein [Enterococcus dongliensis]